MKWYNLFKIELLESIRDKGTVLIVILAIVFSLVIGYYKSTEGERSLKVALVNLDQGELGEEIVNELEYRNDIKIIVTDRESAETLLKRDDVETVAIINCDLTKQIMAGDYEGLITIINATSSRYHATVIEPLINSIMVMWMEEKLTKDIYKLYDEYGIDYTEEDILTFKDEIKEIRNEGSVIRVNKIITEDTEESAAIIKWPYFAAAWYAVMAFFYLVISGSWILELSKLNLRKRTEREGLKQGALYFSMSAPKIILVLIGLLIIMLISGASSLTVLEYFKIFFGFLIYSIGILGMAMLMASFSKNLTSLMVLAPFSTFLFGVLSGLIIELPKWAYTFELISLILPGRWYYGILIDSNNYLLAVLCSVIWLFLGYIFSNYRGKKLTKTNN